MQNYQSILTQMQETYTNLSGASPDNASDIGIRLKILAEQIWNLTQAIQNAEKQAFPQTADGLFLELHAKQRGLERKAAVSSAGTATFLRTSPAQTDIIIQEGVLLAASGGNGLRFSTTQKAVLKAGELKTTANVCCEVPGKTGNIAAGMLTVMVTPVSGIATVTNTSPIDTGEDEETDAALRQRLLDSYSDLTNGTNSAFYYNMAMGYPGVASVRVIPRIKGTGSVGIIIHGAGVDAGLIGKMEAEIGAIKELNVDVSIEKATEKKCPIKAEIAVKDGCSFEDITAICKEKLTELFLQQKVGNPLLGALVIKKLLECEGVANCKIIEPSTDLYPLEKEIIIPSEIIFTRMAIK